MLKRLPEIKNIFPVFAVIVTIIFGWSILVFFWKIPSWLFFLQFDEILVILAYDLTINLLGSILFLGVLLLICIVLPPQYFKNNFTAQGGFASLLSLGSLAFYINRFSELGVDFLKYFPIWLIATIVITLAVSAFAPRVSFLTVGMLWLSDRLIIFLYPVMPLSICSLIVVIIRNVY